MIRNIFIYFSVGSAQGLLVPEAIIIENKATSKLYKDYFEILWKNARK